MASRDVLMILFDGVQSLDVTGPLEVLAGANRWRAAGGGQPFYRVRTASLGGSAVRTSSGITITPDADLGRQWPHGLLLVPGGEGTRQPCPGLTGWLRERAPAARQVISVCTGAFLLADAGLLAGRTVTTHWAYCESMARRFPDVNVLAEPVYVRDGKFLTSAGVTCGIDVALAVVEEDLGRDAALTVARHLVVFLRRPGNQAQFSAQLASQFARRPPVRDLQQWIAEHPGDDLSVPALAQRASLSERQFSRVFAAEVGVTPGRYVDQVRIEAARRHLEDTADSIEQIAAACGYGTPETMRRAFLRSLGVGPAEYRRRFRPSPPMAGIHQPTSSQESHGHRHLAV
jgi:transcriptional regulator GlxA family with amidase domain